MSKDVAKKLKYQAPRLLPLDGVTTAEGSACTNGMGPKAHCGIGSGATGGSCGDGNAALNSSCGTGNDAAGCNPTGSVAVK